MPTIKVSYNEEVDKQQFNTFLFNGRFLSKRPHAKNAVLYSFPDLKERLETNDEPSVVDEFIHELHDKHADELESIKRDIEIQVEKHWKDIFVGLERSMNCKIPEHTDYFIELSFAPYWTYGNNKATVSVLWMIRKIERNEAIWVFLHEISHDIFEQKMKEFWLGEILNSTAYQFLKETIAPIIIRTPYFDQVISSDSRFKMPNPEQSLIVVQEGDKQYSLVDYFDILYKHYIVEWKNFDDFLMVSVDRIRKIQDTLQTKQQDFFSISTKMRPSDEEFNKKMEELWYSDPIIIE